MKSCHTISKLGLHGTLSYLYKVRPSINHHHTTEAQSILCYDTRTTPSMDPLTTLPAEIVLRCLEFADIPSLATLTRLNKPWHAFVDSAHQDTIYSSPSKTSHPRGARDFAFLQHSTSFSNYFAGVSSWKDLCKRQLLLNQNWEEKEPETRESVIQVGNDAVWRFRADFRRRFILSTSQQGGMNVTDMDSGASLWRLTGEEVRPFAHLEYDDGTAVWDREGEAVEVWKCEGEGLHRGQFRRVAILPHDCQTRGFQLSFDTLCVVSTEGQGFVYDMTVEPPTLKTHLKIREDAVGHLDQEEDVVMYSLGPKGYHVHDKATGDLLGILHPKHCNDLYHVYHPTQEPNTDLTSEATLNALPSVKICPPSHPTKQRLCPIEVQSGALPRQETDTPTAVDEDEWGAGMLSDNLMVGVSKSGRVFICSDWRAALKSDEGFKSSTALLECESDGSSFDLGGWLSIRNNRIMFEIQDRVYVVTLDENSRVVPKESPEALSSFSFATSSAAQLAVPVSFMALFDDCIMSTYTTLGWRRRIHGALQEHPEEFPEERTRIFPTKTVRVISFAPNLDADEDADTVTAPRDMVQTGQGGPQATLLHIINMLGAARDVSDESSDED